MTVNDLIRELESLKPSLKEIEVGVIAPNGLVFEPKIRQQHDNGADVWSNVEPDRIILSYD